MWFNSYTIICPRFNNWGETGSTLKISAGSKNGNILSPFAETSVVLPDFSNFIRICLPLVLLSSKFISDDISYFCCWLKSHFVNGTSFCNVCNICQMFLNHLLVVKKLYAV